MTKKRKSKKNTYIKSAVATQRGLRSASRGIKRIGKHK